MAFRKGTAGIACPAVKIAEIAKTMRKPIIIVLFPTSQVEGGTMAIEVKLRMSIYLSQRAKLPYFTASYSLRQSEALRYTSPSVIPRQECTNLPLRMTIDDGSQRRGQIALDIFVGEHRSLGIEHGLTHELLRGDRFDGFAPSFSEFWNACGAADIAIADLLKGPDRWVAGRPSHGSVSQILLMGAVTIYLHLLRVGQTARFRRKTVYL